MQNVIVYSKPVCPNCDQAKQLLESKGIEFTYVDLEQDMTSFFKFRGLGIREVPVIEVDGELVNLASLRKLLAN
jgi:glutaredoxin